MSAEMLAPLDAQDWNARAARHLLCRAGFGVPRARTAELAAMPVEDAVGSFVDFRSIPSQFTPPGFLPEYPAGRMDAKSGDDTQRRIANRERRKVEREAVDRLQSWWLQRMAETPRPLEEKLTLFWHGHFAASAQKVNSSYLNYHLNDTFRKMAAGNFKDLTLAAAQSPAMLRYLDNQRNVKGHPNENWARELMELFTMGQGAYTEDDVKESARAFTGWSYDRRGFVFNTSRHDTGMKTFLGRDGAFDGYDIIDTIFDQPATATFICAKLWSFFAYENPEPELVSGLAAEFRANAYELRPLLRTMFLSRAFYSNRAIGSRIKSPVECALQAAADLNLRYPPYAFMARRCAYMGQNLFYPPNVKGWDGGRAWINSNTLFQRYNLPMELAAAGIVQETLPEQDSGESTPMNTPDATGAYFRQLLDDAPAETARAYRALLDGADREERRGILLDALIELAPASVWDVRRAYEGLPFDSAAACVDALAERLLGRPLAQKQQQQLVGILAPETDGAPSDGFADDRLLAALRLMMSLAEYQLA